MGPRESVDDDDYGVFVRIFPFTPPSSLRPSDPRSGDLGTCHRNLTLVTVVGPSPYFRRKCFVPDSRSLSGGNT